MDEADLRTWLILLRAPGGAAVRGLIESRGSARAALAAGPSAWRAAGLKVETIAALQSPDQARIDADLAWLAAPDHHLIDWDSHDYPALLRRIQNPPPVLFVAGDPDLLWHPQVAVVGSRHPSAGGRDNARDFARALARSGLAVTSGLAAGIDTAAHLGALEAPGRTIAVIGTGPDLAYPRANAALMARIAAEGTVVSEHPPGTPPLQAHFPSRNRIIAGLALGTLVIEAAERSGALITARLAGEAGRDTFAVPGSIHNPLARGCHRLIRQGAALVEDAREVIAALGPLAAELADALRTRLDLQPVPAVTPASSAPVKVALLEDADYRRLFDALGHDPVGLDRLAARTGLTVAALSSMLLLMELEGLVVADHGRYLRRSA